ncbi:MAG: O-antigen ligase family protein, partial [Parcubacteria group bacterium]
MLGLFPTTWLSAIMAGLLCGLFLWLFIRRLEWSIYLSLFFFTLDIYRIQAPMVGGIAPFHMILIVGLIAWLARVLVAGKTIFRHRFDLVFLVGYFCVIFISFLRTRSFTFASGNLFVLLAGLAFVFLANQALNDDRKVFRVAIFFATSQLFVLLGAIYQLRLWWQGSRLLGIPFQHQLPFAIPDVVDLQYSTIQASGFPRFVLPFASAAGTGCFLALSAILVLGVLLCLLAEGKGQKMKKILLSGLLGINLFLLVGTFARTSWIMFLVGAGVLTFLFRRLVFRVRIIFPALLITIASCLILIQIIPAPRIYSRVSANQSTIKSFSGHWQTRMMALGLFAQHPVFGIGYGNFFAVTGGRHSHSQYTTVLAEEGLIGLILLAVFVWQLLNLSWSAVTDITRAPRSRRVNMIFFAAFLSLVVGNIFYQLDGEMYWIIVGLL